MKDFRILIVDDEILIAEDLKDILLSLGFESVDLAHDKREALVRLNEFSPDIVLLDIRMEGELDGLEIAEQINLSTKIPFIYVTSHSDVAMIKQIVKTKPAGYITKPFKKSDLFAAINLACEKSSRNKIIIKDGYKSLVIDSEDIDYVESEGNYITIFCGPKKIVSRQSIDRFLSDLNDKQFIRIHRSYIINTSKIVKFSKKDLTIGNVTLPVSRNYTDVLEERMKSIG